jgi:uroporphyrinogen decarboxylase
MKISKTPHSIYSTNAASMASAQLYSHKKYGCDGLHITTDNQVLCEAFGGVVNFPYDEPPQIKRRALLDKDLSKLPKVTAKSGRMGVICEATKIVRQELHNGAFIKTNIDSGPFSAACSLRGEEELFTDLYDDESFVFDLLELCGSAIIEYGKAAVEAGAHALTLGDSTAGLMHPGFYEKFALPYAKHVISELKKTGAPIFYHVCGNTSHVSHLLAQTGADVLEIDSMVPFESMMQHIRGKVALEGNVSTIVALLNGSPGQVRSEAVACMKPFGLNGGLVLSSGCEVPPFTKEENILAMVDAAREGMGQAPESGPVGKP